MRRARSQSPWLWRAGAPMLRAPPRKSCHGRSLFAAPLGVVPACAEGLDAADDLCVVAAGVVFLSEKPQLPR